MTDSDALNSNTTNAPDSSQPPHLTDDQCETFRRLPCNFNDMVRAIYQTGYAAGHAKQAATVEQLRAQAKRTTNSAIRIAIGTPCAHHLQPEHAPLDAFIALGRQCALCNAEKAAAFESGQPPRS